jgi:hypothetical protein
MSIVRHTMRKVVQPRSTQARTTILVRKRMRQGSLHGHGEVSVCLFQAARTKKIAAIAAPAAPALDLRDHETAVGVFVDAVDPSRFTPHLSATMFSAALASSESAMDSRHSLLSCKGKRCVFGATLEMVIRLR